MKRELDLQGYIIKEPNWDHDLFGELFVFDLFLLRQRDTIFADFWFEYLLVGEFKHEKFVVDLFVVLDQAADQVDGVVVEDGAEGVDGFEGAIGGFDAGPAEHEEVEEPDVFEYFFVDFLAANQQEVLVVNRDELMINPALWE